MILKKCVIKGLGELSLLPLENSVDAGDLIFRQRLFMLFSIGTGPKNANNIANLRMLTFKNAIIRD